jgi:hypothetical protein
MKNNIFIAVIAAVAVLAPIAVAPAQALSCLPVDMFLKDIVGKEEVVVFVGTVSDQIMETDYTAEVITVTEVKQGYAEESLFAYHQKSIDWGYFCNAGPAAKEGQESLYVANRDAFGKYIVAQRLALTDPLAVTLEADLKKAEIEGTVAEITPTDRMNQIMTTVSDLFKEIKTLFKEYMYLKTM